MNNLDYNTLGPYYLIKRIKQKPKREITNGVNEDTIKTETTHSLSVNVIKNNNNSEKK